MAGLLFQWKHEAIREWYSPKPCQNDISLRESTWTLVSNDPGPDYSGYKTMKPEEVYLYYTGTYKLTVEQWNIVCKSGSIWTKWSRVFDDSCMKC